MTKERVVELLIENGCRITKQRKLIIDVIFDYECSCCKEIYYQVLQIDHNIGIATVYRMLNMLEEIGVINRNKMYQIASVV